MKTFAVTIELTNIENGHVTSTWRIFRGENIDEAKERAECYAIENFELQDWLEYRFGEFEEVEYDIISGSYKKV